MPNIIFSEGSGLNNSVFGAAQAPIRMMIENYGQECEKKSVLENLFKMGTSENYADLMTEMTAMSGFEPVGENGAYPSDGMQEGNQKLIVYETWKDEFRASQEMMEDNKLVDLGDRPKQFVSGFYRTREEFGAALYAGAIMGNKTMIFKKKAFDTTSADGLPMFSAAHTALLSKKKQSNRFSNAFSVDALDRAEAAMHLYEGENGEILGISPDTILIPEHPDLKRAVFAAIGADKDPDSANNGFNFQYGRWNVCIWPYLNQFLKKGLRPWVMLDSQFNDLFGGAVWNDRIPLTIKSYIEQGTDANVWGGRARWNAVFKSWQYAAVGGMEGGTDLTTLEL